MDDPHVLVIGTSCLDVKGQAGQPLQRGTSIPGIIHSSAGGVARQNLCTGNGLHGISVNERAQPTLESNECKDNGRAGIRYWDTAGGVARQNLCTANRWGIYIEKTAAPELVENDCHGNTEGDIVDP